MFLSLPVKHRSIIAAPLLERLDLSAYLGGGIEEVSVSGESGLDARVCDYDWVLDLRSQCIEKNVPFSFHQTGARLQKGGRLYRVPRAAQIAQAKRAGIDFRIGPDGIPETAVYSPAPAEPEQLRLL